LEDGETAAPLNGQTDTDDTASAMKDRYSGSFSILRLFINKDSFLLQKGALEGQQFQYTDAVKCDLPNPISPAVWKSDDSVAELIGFIKEKIREQLSGESRFIIVFPSHWGIIREVEVPKSVPEEMRQSHISWALHLTGWEDGESARYNYTHIGSGIYKVAALRESLVLFAQAIADELDIRLVQLSLSDSINLNLITDEEKTPETAVEPVESPYEKKSKAPIIIPIIFLILAASGYYLIGVKKLHRQFFPPQKTITADTLTAAVPDSVPADTAKAIAEVKPEPVKIDTVKNIPPPPPVKEKPASPAPIISAEKRAFTDVFNELHKQGAIYYLSFTGSDIKCEFSAASKAKIDGVVSQLQSSGLAAGLKTDKVNTEQGTVSAFISGMIDDKLMSKYTHPTPEQVKTILNKAGYKTDAGNPRYDVFTGGAKNIGSILQTIDDNKVLIYRIRITSIAEGGYALTLEY